jgi:hypothetical protein
VSARAIAAQHCKALRLPCVFRQCGFYTYYFQADHASLDEKKVSMADLLKLNYFDA